MAVIPGLVPECRLDVGHGHARTSQINAKLEERCVASPGGCAMLLMNGFALTLVAAIMKFRYLLLPQ
jgi:hypothetical protein